MTAAPQPIAFVTIREDHLRIVGHALSAAAPLLSLNDRCLCVQIKSQIDRFLGTKPRPYTLALA